MRPLSRGLVSARTTLEPWFNEPLYNKVLDITDNSLHPSNNKIWKKTDLTRCYSKDILPVPWPFVISRFHSIGLALLEGKMNQNMHCDWLPGLPAVSHKETVFTKLVCSKWVDNSMDKSLFFFAFLWTLTPSHKKRTWPISSHLDWRSLVNSPCLLFSGRVDHTNPMVHNCRVWSNYEQFFSTLILPLWYKTYHLDQFLRN